MSESPDQPRVRRILDPIDRYSEVLFGLYMVLTFTGTLSVTSAGDEGVRTMLIAAIGCNTAWGFVDAMMYVLRNMVARGGWAQLVRQVQADPSPQIAHRLITEELGPLAAGLDANGIESLRRWLQAQPTPPRHMSATRDDLLGALAVFLLVLGSTFPVVLPFLFMSDLRMAMRVSGAIAIAIVFFCGFAWGRYAGAPPWRAGIVMVLIAAVIQAVVILLGG
jgi:VIT1/CCC1 family predicted Fe2+/Mn2+ transporter